MSAPTTTYTQKNSPLAVKTALKKQDGSPDSDALLLVGFRGKAGISELFRYELEMLAPRANTIAFEKILGQPVSVRLTGATVATNPGGKPQGTRYFHGILSEVVRTGGDDTFITYRAEMVPRLWLQTLNKNSRVFQEESTPTILQNLLPKPARFKLQANPAFIPHFGGEAFIYPQRDYCVQYRESDCDFLGRLMEDDGIYYFFTHSDTDHVLIVSDAQQNLEPSAPGMLRTYEFRDDKGPESIHEWERGQRVRAGKYTLGDYYFERSDQATQYAAAITAEAVPVGEAKHTLNLKVYSDQGIYDYPGSFAHRSSVNKTGNDSPGNLDKVGTEGARLVKVRMEEEAAQSLWIRGKSNAFHMEPGCKFATRVAATTHPRKEDSGGYFVTGIQHTARYENAYRSGKTPTFTYENQFTALPVALTYRPPRKTPKPVILGVQTAKVQGFKGTVPVDLPRGYEEYAKLRTDDEKKKWLDANVKPAERQEWEAKKAKAEAALEQNQLIESTTVADKYGRVKVLFPWDREGSYLNSSCWVRVAQVWAGQKWGAFFWPRPGHEVVVAFEEGNPDRPVIVGSVYNNVNLPPVDPKSQAYSGGIKSCSMGLRTPAPAPGVDLFNCLVFHDGPNMGQDEHLQVHSCINELVTNVGGKRSFNAGSVLEIVGTFPSVPELGVGSGSGGGVFDLTQLAYLLGGWKGFFETPYYANFLRHLQGKQSVVIGSRLDATLLGNRVVRSWGNSETKMLGDFQQVIADAFEKIPGIPTKLGKLPLGELLASLGGLRGYNELIWGDNKRLSYYGKKIDIARCKTYHYKAGSFFSLTSKMVNTLTLFTLLFHVTIDVLIRVLCDWKEHYSKLYVPLGLNMTGGILHAVLVDIETKLAIAEAAKVKAQEAKDILDQIKEDIKQVVAPEITNATTQLSQQLLGTVRVMIYAGKDAVKDIGVG